jgi:hypothetical protein
MRKRSGLALLLVLSGCGDSCSCESKPSPNASAARSAASAVPVVPWQAFAPFAPDALGEYRADGEAKGRVFDDLPAGSKLSTLKRSYSKGDSKLEIELIDSVQAAGLHALFSTLSRMNRTTALSVVQATTVSGYPALAQWNKGTGVARVGVLVAERWVVNVNVKPETSPDAAVTLAQHVDFAGLAKLSATAK